MGNIGEGFGRYFYKSSMQFYDIARGCLNEVKSDMYLSFDIGYITEVILYKFLKQIKIVDSKTSGLIIQTKIQLENQK